MKTRRGIIESYRIFDRVKFIGSRVLSAVIVLFGLSILVFVLARMIPGDPALLAAGTRAPEWLLIRVRTEMHLNEPIYLQYVYWLGDALRGNLGYSLRTQRPVVTDVAEFFPATMELILFSLLFSLPLGQFFGIAAGRRPESWIDNVVRMIAYAGMAIPPFVFGLVFMLLFGLNLNILPASGRITMGTAMPPVITGFVTIDSLIGGRMDVFVDALKHLLMPAIALSMVSVAQESRLTRFGMVENSKMPYIQLARAFGLPERVISLKYQLKPSLIPTVSVMALDFASLLSNAFLIETIFFWPGFSRYAVNAVLMKDLNSICGVVLVIGLVYSIVNILADVVVGFLDPRISLRKRIK